MDYATLSNEQNFTVFRYGRHMIRFKAPYSLENLHFDVEEFLEPIKEVRIEYR